MRDLFFMPRLVGQPFYPGGLPLGPSQTMWQSNVWDELKEAKRKYWNYLVKKAPEPSDHEKELLFQFVTYYIHAPVWEVTCGEDEEMEQQLMEVRRLANEITTLEQLSDFEMKCMDLGLDPL